MFFKDAFENRRSKSPTIHSRDPHPIRESRWDVRWRRLRNHACAPSTTVAFPVAVVVAVDSCSSASIIFSLRTTCACSSKSLANSPRLVSASTWICLILSRGPPGLSSGVCDAEFCELLSRDNPSRSEPSELRIECESTSSTTRLQTHTNESTVTTRSRTLQDYIQIIYAIIRTPRIPASLYDASLYAPSSEIEPDRARSNDPRSRVRTDRYRRLKSS